MSDSVQYSDASIIEGAFGGGVISSPQSSSRERRRHERRTMKGHAFLLLPKHEPIKVRTLDVSISGLAVIAPFNAAQSGICTIRFLLPATPTEYIPISTAADITHSFFTSGEDGFKIGLMFNDLAPRLVAMIDNFVRASLQAR